MTIHPTAPLYTALVAKLAEVTAEQDRALGTPTDMSDHDYGHEAQAAAEAHLTAIYEAEDIDVESPAIGLWCGCEACIVREVLHAAWPVFEKYARQQP